MHFCRALLLTAAPLLVGACAATTDTGPAATPAGYVVLISFDGFRHDYLDRGLTPTFDSLAHAGVRAQRLLPVTPTKTFPNHYSIATGLYPDAHRLVANTFIDPARAERYSPADRASVEDGSWYGGEPIWVTAQRQGLRSATMFWVGSEGDVLGVRPDIWHPYNERIAPEARVDTVLSWLRLPLAARPRLITLYFEFTDDAGSRFGPDSPQADSAIARADRMLSRLLAGTRTLPHADSIAYVVVSDHGMANHEGTIALEQYVRRDSVNTTRILHGPFAVFHLNGDSARTVALQQQLAAMPHTRTFRREELPAEWRWSDPRLGDVITVADPYWLITATANAEPQIGAHGWPADNSAMHGIFVAAGAGIPQRGIIPPFRNVHIHGWIAELLGIEKAAGSERALQLR